ncbi:SigE family RNA polymerase sigma factor [Catenulispora rubra]|uniref:SigE family RNA polymerase sigma factor n=1 Tax=Catenulispora rubra TaxID=280293 RepID=UPI0018924554|nr:SigE family RNA polymerase sigma factor [Catenulispora rubra]
MCCGFWSGISLKESDAEFDEFVAAMSLPLLKTARLLTGDWHLGEDLAQVTLVKVYRHWARIEHRDSPVDYARKVMVNTYLTWRRRRWRGEVPAPVLPEVRDRSDVAEAVAAVDELQRALLALPRRQRAVVVLRFYEDLTVAQTAAALDCPEGTVTSLTARALTRLRSSSMLRPETVEGRK